MKPNQNLSDCYHRAVANCEKVDAWTFETFYAKEIVQLTLAEARWYMPEESYVDLKKSVYEKFGFKE